MGTDREKRYQKTHKLGRTCDYVDARGRRCDAPITDTNGSGRCLAHPGDYSKRGSGVPQTPLVEKDDPKARRYE